MRRPGSSIARYAVASAMLAGLGAACSLSQSFDGLTTTGQPADASSDGTVDVGVVDAPVDVPGPDGGDAPEAGDAGPWCTRLQPTPFFCLDFDEGELTKGYQSGVLVFAPMPEVSANCKASVGTDGRSPPGAFLTEFPATGSGAPIMNVYYGGPGGIL